MSILSILLKLFMSNTGISSLIASFKDSPNKKSILLIGGIALFIFVSSFLLVRANNAKNEREMAQLVAENIAYHDKLRNVYSYKDSLDTERSIWAKFSTPNLDSLEDSVAEELLSLWNEEKKELQSTISFLESRPPLLVVDTVYADSGSTDNLRRFHIHEEQEGIGVKLDMQVDIAQNSLRYDLKTWIEESAYKIYTVKVEAEPNVFINEVWIDGPGTVTKLDSYNIPQYSTIPHAFKNAISPKFVSVDLGALLALEGNMKYQGVFVGSEISTRYINRTRGVLGFWKDPFENSSIITAGIRYRLF